jgi:5-methylcytosine-specific restriction protein A
MKFTVSEFLTFAKAVESYDWLTLTQKKPYRYTVENQGIRLYPSTGMGRKISNWEIKRFCEIYSVNNSTKTLDYKKLFNKSYLLPIAKLFNPELFEYKLPEEIIDITDLHEGASRQIFVNAYERNAEARRQCLEAHGTNCVVCNFSFEEIYGDIATGFIHVHHLSPIALKGGKYKINPVKDLRPVCPNCHAVIHLRGGCLSIEELKGILVKHK